MAETLTTQQRDVIDRLARRVVRMRMSEVAVLFIESFQPLNFVGSQLLHFFGPFVRGFGFYGDYEALAHILEDRRCVDWLLEAIEREEAALEKGQAHERPR